MAEVHECEQRSKDQQDLVIALRDRYTARIRIRKNGAFGEKVEISGAEAPQLVTLQVR